MKKLLTFALAIYFSLSLSCLAQEKRYIFEITIKNNSTKVSTTMRIFATDEADAREQVELNGWQIQGVKQITFKYGEEVPVQVSSDPAGLKSAKTEPPPETNEEIVNSLLGPPVADTPPPLPKEPPVLMPPLLPDSDRLIYLFTVYFDFGIVGPALGEEEKAHLAKVNGENVYYVFGHTDNVSVNKLTTAYTDNFDLSFKRAEAIKKLLIENSADPKKISGVGLGPTYPAAPNTDNKTGTPRNRRATVYVLKTE